MPGFLLLLLGDGINLGFVVVRLVSVGPDRLAVFLSSDARRLLLVVAARQHDIVADLRCIGRPVADFVAVLAGLRVHCEAVVAAFLRQWLRLVRGFDVRHVFLLSLPPNLLARWAARRRD